MGRLLRLVVVMLVCVMAPQAMAGSTPPAWIKALMGKIKPLLAQPSARCSTPNCVLRLGKLVQNSQFTYCIIQHIIVLMEENRSFDHFFGFAGKKLGVNGLSGNEFNYINLSNPAQGKVQVAQNGRYVNPCDPDHGTPATALKMQQSMGGFVSYENGKGHGTTDLNWCDVMSVFDNDKIPIITTLAEEYALMDRMFCSHPGPTWPNRLYALTATSNGMTSTGAWYQDQPGKLFPQKAFFDQVDEAGMTWKNYYNDTPWELFLETIAHNPANIRPLTELYEDAAAGNLPNYAWINPRCGMNITTGQGSNDQHPDHDVSLGEALIKDIYESLRASPQWNETLFIITYDEHGGFYDHVVPPKAPAPDKTEPASYPDKFNFTNAQLGVRIPTLLISPWIEKGVVLSEPPAEQRPSPDSEYDLTSIMATARKLLGMPNTPLTLRDAWAGTFEHLLNRTEPRTDCPVHLPAVPDSELKPSDEANLPLNDLQRTISEVHAHVLGGPDPASDARDLAGRRQGHVSEWVQSRYEKHVVKTMEWRQSKQASVGPNASYTVMTRPPSMSGWKATFKLSFEDKINFQTINTEVAGDDYCLDSSAAGSSGGPVGYSKCYPSTAPGTNRDSDQHWVVLTDTTIRPASHPDMCLTNVLVSPPDDFAVYNVSVVPCDGRFEQHWGTGVVNPTDKVSSLSFATSESIGLV